MFDLLLGGYVPDIYNYSARMVFMDDACLDTSLAYRSLGTCKWMLLTDADYGCWITVYSLFLHAGFWRDLCTVSDDICNRRPVCSKLFKRKSYTDYI